MRTTTRRFAATVAGTAAAAAGLVTLSLAAPAHAATTTTSSTGHTTIALSDQDVADLTAPTASAYEAVCGPVVADVISQRHSAHVSGFFSMPICRDIARACIAQVGGHTQINLAPDNTYTCTNYSTSDAELSRVGAPLLS